MSAVVSQQPLKEDEEEDDEDQGEEFVFEDSSDEDNKVNGSDSTRSAQMTSAVLVTDGTQLLQTSPPAGREVEEDAASISEAGKLLS